MSPLRFNCSIFRVSCCPRRLSALLNVFRNRTHGERYKKKWPTPAPLDIWIPVWCRDSLHDGWRMHINHATDGDLGTATSADIVLLTGPFHQSCFQRDSGEKGKCELRGENVLGLIYPKVHQDRKKIIWLALTERSPCFSRTWAAVKPAVLLLDCRISLTHQVHHKKREENVKREFISTQSFCGHSYELRRDGKFSSRVRRERKIEQFLKRKCWAGHIYWLTGYHHLVGFCSFSWHFLLPTA